MKELTVSAYCDGGHEEKVPATIERTITVDAVSRVVDVCEACDRRFVLPVVALMENGAEVEESHPRKGIGGRKKQNLPTDCVICGHHAPNRSALGSHVRARHQMTLTQMEGRR